MSSVSLMSRYHNRAAQLNYMARLTEGRLGFSQKVLIRERQRLAKVLNNDYVLMKRSEIISLSSFHPSANRHYGSFGVVGHALKSFRLYTSSGQNSKNYSISRLENETKSTSQYIEKMILGIDPKYEINKSMIQQEIQEAAAEIGSSIPESGPTGLYTYFFDDDLNLGKRSYRRKLKPDNSSHGQEQHVFDINLHFEYLGPMSLSIDEKYVARMITYIGTGLKPKILITAIDSGLEYTMKNDSRHNIHNVEFGPKYTNDSIDYHSLFVTTCDEIGRPNAVYACTFNGELFSRMELVVKDNDAANFVDVQRTKGCEYVAINSTSKTDNEVHLVGGEVNKYQVLDEGIPWSPILVRKREDGVQYYVECGNRGDVILLAHRFLKRCNDVIISENNTDLLGDEISVFEESIQHLPLLASSRFGKPLHKHSNKLLFFVEDIDLFEDYLVLYERSSVDAGQRIRILDRNSKDCEGHIVSLEDLHWIQHLMITPGGNMHFSTDSLNFSAETPLTPPVTCRYDFEARLLTTEYSDSNLEKKYESRRFNIISDDISSIPLSLYFDKTVFTNGVILIGYGSYGQSQNLAYDPALLPLVKRGFMIAFCHGRGGGDLGKKWYEAGRLYNKKNAINDYMTCAKVLSEGKIQIPNINPKRNSKSLFIGCKAFSAGGVLIAAAMNESPPDVFDAISLTNPFLDVMGTMSTPPSTHFLTEHEWDEFGDPTSDCKAHSIISTYCPILNVNESQSYPPMLVVSTIDDENVPYNNGVRYVTKVRDMIKTKNESKSVYPTEDEMDNDILLHIEKEGGHHLHGRKLDVCTLEACFLLGQLYNTTES